MEIYGLNFKNGSHKYMTEQEIVNLTEDEIKKLDEIVTEIYEPGLEEPLTNPELIKLIKQT